ncbi:SWIM zinc finger containing protein [Halalkaliarchaeum sp. AArc-CO]|nr:SWIM zinc finger containing protein [Halalkaliarchaeum sp. AArc-CO]
MRNESESDPSDTKELYDASIFRVRDGISLLYMDVTVDDVRELCTDAVYERGENYLAEGRIREIHRVNSTVTAVLTSSPR